MSFQTQWVEAVSMAKRAQLSRQSRAYPDYDSRFTSEARPGKEPRKKSKFRQQDPDHNIVDLNAHSAQLATAYAPRRIKAPLSAQTPAQQLYINAIRNHALTFGIGPAGTGKSYCAGALAAEALESGRIERIILTRPAVEAGENLGFLPGDLNEKYAVYIDAFRDILNERLGSGVVDYCLRHGRIVGAPLAYMRGKTFSHNTFVILDEAQNTTPAQMKMFLTRIGEHAKVVINGDINQSDLRGANGLEDAIHKVRGLPDVHIHEFARADIVRSGLVRMIMDRYEPG
jgi:phosphate starvation-inducible protein PhoH and related proteins